MFCRFCGTENADNAPTCISCGNALTNPYQGTAQGAVGPTPAAGKPPNYLIQAILVTLCCCLPFGIVAIVYADFSEPFMLSLTVAISILAAMVIAAVVGGAVPLIFERLNIDPAIAAGPFVTTAVDVLGILTYFSIATALLTI